MTEPSPVENQRFPVKILHFDLSHKTETGYPPGLQDHCFFFFLSFNDSSFLAMRPAFRLAFRLDQLLVLRRPNPSAWLLVLLGLPTRSSTSPLSLGRTWVPFRLAFRLSDGLWAYSVVLLDGFPVISGLMGLLGRPTGWLSGYQLADRPTRSSYSVAQVPISLGI